jgi:hypothetical protein
MIRRVSYTKKGILERYNISPQTREGIEKGLAVVWTDM